MNPWVFALLFAVAGVLMLLEMRGVPMTLRLTFKGDIKRESQFLAQFGQALATGITAALIYAMERTPGGPVWISHWPSTWAELQEIPEFVRKPLTVIGSVAASGFCVYAIKRLAGRVRPNRPDAGKFLGFSTRHANWRESFPSSHSASAMALAEALSELYPQGTPIFWTLGISTALLRYVMDAHWPSDVFTGAALGWAIGEGVTTLFGY